MTALSFAFGDFMPDKLSDKELASFRPFDDELEGIIADFTTGFDYLGSDYSYYAFLSWFDVGEYLVRGDVLYLRCVMDGETYYWPPLVKGSSVTVEEAALALPDNAMFAFCTESFVNAMYGGYYVFTHRDWSEYIYEVADFVALPGKRYHAKRNHIAKFQRLYSYAIAPYKREDDAEIEAFERAWLEEKGFEGRQLENAEREREIVRRWLDAAEQGKLKCDVLRVDGKMVGIAIGQIMPTGVAVEMYEKADAAYEGVYSFLAHEFAARNFAECRYLNRQEDMGIEGLRKSKLSYYPSVVLDKYVLKPAAAVSECYAARTGRIFSKEVRKRLLPHDRYTVKNLGEDDFDNVYSFLEREREGLKDKKFFLNYTEEELRGVLRGGGMYGAFVGDELIATCAYDTDEEYAARLAEICGAVGEKYYEFSGIMTAARYRGLGVSGRLCAYVLDKAVEALSPATLCAVVQYDNVPSLTNLKKMGFCIRTTKPCGDYTFSYLTRTV